MKGAKDYKGLLILIGAIVAIPLIAWFFGFKNTVELKRKYREREVRIGQLKTESTAGGLISMEEISLNVPVLNNGEILRKIGNDLKREKVSVIRYTPYLTRTEDQLMVYTGELILTGRYIPLLKILHTMEKNPALGKVISVAFRLHKDRIKKTEQLRMVLVVQQLTKNE